MRIAHGQPGAGKGELWIPRDRESFVLVETGAQADYDCRILQQAMTTAVVICDDSAVARKQIARALPEDWDIELGFVTNGREALDAIRAGRAEVLFLDLTMPGMDGYQTLKYMSAVGLTADVIVISADVQATAQRRVLDLGARAFLKKPVGRDELRAVLQSLGRIGPGGQVAGVAVRPPPAPHAFDTEDALQEVVNIAVGHHDRAGQSNLSRSVACSQATCRARFYER